MTTIIALAVMAVLLYLAWKGYLDCTWKRTTAAIVFWPSSIYFISMLWGNSAPTFLVSILLYVGPLIAFIVFAGWGVQNAPPTPPPEPPHTPYANTLNVRSAAEIATEQEAIISLRLKHDIHSDILTVIRESERASHAGKRDLSYSRPVDRTLRLRDAEQRILGLNSHLSPDSLTMNHEQFHRYLKGLSNGIQVGLRNEGYQDVTVEIQGSSSTRLVISCRW